MDFQTAPPSGNNYEFHKMTSPIQKIALYETKMRYYLIGTNNTQTKFRVLKIDRMDPRELHIENDPCEYTKTEIQKIVNMLDHGNRPRQISHLGPGGFSPVASAFGIVVCTAYEIAAVGTGKHLPQSAQLFLSISSALPQAVWHAISPPESIKRVSAFGLLGFVRFLEGYYIVLLTKRHHVAVIGHHTIYKVQNTSLIYIPNESVRIHHPDEARYVKMFQSIDLSSNFYFSYSYDITHSLQYNLTSPLCRPEMKSDDKHGKMSCCGDKSENRSAREHFAERSEPNRRFVWNSYLLQEIEGIVAPDWILYLVHGFVSQYNMSVLGRPIYVTLLARRSNRYAGTRFLKRGANFLGDVANEVETEQIVHDSGVSSLKAGRFSSFVQMRGSIPAYWSQDIIKMVPKPAITFDLPDPFSEPAGKHMNQLLCRYGSPIIILNLVKKKEKKIHESQLSAELINSVKYLNQFLPPEHHIIYVSFDMARKNKLKDENVMQRLAAISLDAVRRTGIFQSQDPYHPQDASSVLGRPNDVDGRGRVQTGIIRVNCVDCLDRTNTAQFAIGRCALGFQLCSLGLLPTPELEFDTDCIRMLESLYEDHGDTLALQYGGSQLVHRIKTYRKTAPWTSQGNDIMATLSRYISNTFSDYEKQQTINLFLGLFVPDENKPAIWDSPPDYYMSNQRARGLKRQHQYPLTQWWDADLLSILPRAKDELFRKSIQLIRVHPNDERIDAYRDYHQPHRFSVLGDTFAFEISHTVRDFMPHCTTDFSPFTERARLGRRREESGNLSKTSMKNPSLTGRSSTSSTNSSGSSSEGSDDSDPEENLGDPKNSYDAPKNPSTCDTLYTGFESIFPSMEEVYGTMLCAPSRADTLMHNRFVKLGRSATRRIVAPGVVKSKYLAKCIEVELLLQPGYIPDNTSFSTKPPQVTTTAVNTYDRYCKRAYSGAESISPNSMTKYLKFAEMNA